MNDCLTQNKMLLSLNARIHRDPSTSFQASMTLFRRNLPKPSKSKSKGKSMTEIKRNKVYKVRFSDAEVQKIKDANILNIAKYLRDTFLAQIDATQGKAKKKESGTSLH